ncbi:MAG TPA: hypothetical protein VET85_12680 [Stellaceae bacterium]|nr:hypothetical protein [Stellaceae bacterium]
MRHFLFRVSTLCLLAVPVSGCSWFGGDSKSSNKLVCPFSFIAPGLESYTQARPGGGPNDIDFGVRIIDFKTTCAREGRGLVVNATVTFLAGRQGAEFRQGDFTYFIAVADPQQKILAKQTFTLRAEFGPKQSQLRIADDIVEHLPLRDAATGGGYAVIAGMQLSQQQLDAIRARQAPK